MMKDNLRNKNEIMRFNNVKSEIKKKILISDIKSKTLSSVLY